MAVTTTKTNKPINPRGNDQSPKGYNRASLFSGKALDFDGVNDYVSMGTQSFITASGFSFSTKLYLEDDSEHYIFSTGYNNTNSILLYSPASSNDLVFAWYNISSGALLSTGVNYTNDEWFDISVNYNGSILTIYKNGVEVVNESFSIPTIASGPYEIGWASPRAKSTSYLQGKVGGFKIFNTALTAAQVADLYNNPEKIVPTGVSNDALKLWLPMMEGAGTTAYDGSGNGNHGTISGATWTHGIGAPVAQTAVIDWNKASNLVIQSNDFTTSWTPNSISLTIAQAGPTGINDAWKLEKVGAYGNIVQGISVNNASTYTFSIIAKAGNTDFVSIRFSTGAGYDYRHKIDLTDGTTSTASGNDSSGVVYKTQNIGNGWWRFGIVCTTNSTSAFVNAYAGDTADASGYVYIAHAHAEETNELKPYVRTYASSLTDVLLPQGLTSGRDITGVNLFENVRKQGALNLDGNSWAEVHDNASLDITDAITLEAWVYWDSGTDNGILGKWFYDINKRSYLLYQAGVSTISFYISSNGLSTGQNYISSAISNGWRHIVGTDDGTTIRLYIDGVEENSDVSPGSIYTSDRNLRIGNMSLVSQSYPYDIAQPRIYNRALTAEEVARNYDAGKNIYK